MIDSDLYIIRKRRQRHTLVPTYNVRLSLTHYPPISFRLSPFVLASARAPVSLRLIDALPYFVRTHTNAHRLDRRDRRRALLLLYYYYCVCHTDVSFRRNDFDMSTDDGGDMFTALTHIICLPTYIYFILYRKRERAGGRSKLDYIRGSSYT